VSLALCLVIRLPGQFFAMKPNHLPTECLRRVVMTFLNVARRRATGLDWERRKAAGADAAGAVPVDSPTSCACVSHFVTTSNPDVQVFRVHDPGLMVRRIKRSADGIAQCLPALQCRMPRGNRLKVVANSPFGSPLAALPGRLPFLPWIIHRTAGRSHARARGRSPRSRWAESTLDPIAASGSDPKLAELSRRAGLSLKETKQQLLQFKLDLDHGKYHRTEECQQQRVRQIHEVKRLLLELPDSLPFATEVKELARNRVMDMLRKLAS
jgi:hypothetical protein